MSADLERWEKRFSAPAYIFGKEPNVFLRAQAHRLRRGQTALSVADGEGRNGVWLAEQGLDVLAVDFAPSALAKARALAAERGVRLRTQEADVIIWEWPRAAFDVVVGIFIQFTTPAERMRMFEGMKQALKPGGWIFLEGYAAKQLEYGTGGPSQLEQLYTRELLTAAFGDLSSIEINEYESEMSEGERHKGMSALIDLVGRK